MKRNIILLLGALSMLYTASAQSTKQQTLEDLNRTGSLYYSYGNFERVAQTPAPEGYVPFYLSHYGRHGSRWHASKSVYEHPLKVLTAAHEAGTLTKLGEDLYKRVVVIAEDARGRCGDLSPRGTAEHRGIAERMYYSFPEIFSTADGHTCNIRSRATLVPRCILSMAAANERLKELNPQLNIKRESSKRNESYMSHRPASDSIAKIVRPRISKLREQICSTDRLMKSLFKKPKELSERERLELMVDLFSIASIMQDVDYLNYSLYDIFTTDELYTLYSVRNYQMYTEVGPSAEFGDGPKSDACNLLQNFVDEADEAIATGELSASLRYGHDVYVIPLVSLMSVENCDTSESDFDKVNSVWSCWIVSPMATNIQWVFYKRPGSDDVLVKFLFNEREVNVGLKSDIAPYYHWSEVRDYFKQRIATYERKK
jgi:hypothetical protein